MFVAFFSGILGVLPFATGVLFGWAALVNRRDTSSSKFLRGLMIPALLMAVLIAMTAMDLRRRPEGVIRAVLLEETPVGSSPDLVRAAATSRGWRVREGYGNLPSQEVVASTDYLGLPFTVTVVVTWIFDLDGGLRDVQVKKEVDGL
jgi:hypothetical protein